MLTRGWKYPYPLAPIASLIERSAIESVRGLVSVPRQHGKTELVTHGLVWLELHAPGRTHAYVTYSQDRANEVSSRIRRAFERAGIQTDGTQKRIDLSTGGTVFCTGIDGALTGRGISGLAVVDDPHKNREEANSPVTREKVDQAFRAVIGSGMHETASLAVVHTRWHTDDLIGRLETERDEHGEPRYPVINLAAVKDNGQPLWPQLRSIALLERIRWTIGEYEWASLYMGRPRPLGTSVFRDVRYYDKLPDKYRVGIGFDLATTAKTTSDYCAAVVIAESDGEFFVLDVLREHADVATFAARLRVLDATYPGAPMLWYANSTELGTAQLLRELGLKRAFAELATADKVQRAQRVAAAWNGTPESPGMRGREPRVFLPRQAPWLNAFVSEVCGFTGSDRHDDQVDALAAAFDVLERGRGMAIPKAYGTKFDAGGIAPARTGTRFQW